MPTLVATQDLSATDRVRLVVRPVAGVFETQHGPDTAHLQHATRGDLPTYPLTLESRSAGELVVSLPLSATPFPPVSPTDSYHVVVRDTTLSFAGRPLRSVEHRTAAPVVLVRDAGSGPGPVPAQVVFTVTPAALGGQVHLDARPLTGQFAFEAARHAPHLVNEHGQQQPLTEVSGWGSRRLTGRLPGPGFACAPGVRRIVLRDSGLDVAAQVLPPPVVRLSREFRVVVTRFRCHSETYDDTLQRDGKRDEVYFASANVRLSDGVRAGTPEVRTTPVFGDTDGQPGRVRAGSASDKGGIRTGDDHTLAPPCEIWRGRLAQPADAVVLTPMVWEWDQGGSAMPMPASWLDALGTEVRPVLDEVVRATGAPLLGRLPGTVDPRAVLRAPASLPEMSKKDEPGHRPIGVRKQNGTYWFRPQALVLTYALAEALARTGALVPVRYTEPRDWLDGDYEFWLRVEGLGSEQQVTDHGALPAPLETVLTVLPAFAQVRPRVDVTDVPRRPWRLSPR